MSSDPSNTVTVLDASEAFLNNCHPARARLLVKEGKAAWKNGDPPTIQLKRMVAPEQRKLPTMPITNWTKFFEKEGDIYVQNISTSQVSLEFETSPGHSEGFLLKATRNPVNITQHIPFNAVKGSPAFRKMLNRRPPVLQILSEEEFVEYYERKAGAWGVKSAEEAIDKAEQERLGLVHKTAYTTDDKPQPIHEVLSDGRSLSDPKKEVRAFDSVSSDEVINSRVLHLCTQVHSDIKDSEKMKANEMLSELETVESELKIDDYEYLRSHGYWKSVKNWAKARLAKMNEDTSDGAEDSTEA